MTKTLEEMSEEAKKTDGEVLAIAVIGSAGRGDDARKFCPGLFEEMVKRVSRTIKQLSGTIKPLRQKIRLVSGGAAWADHVAVALFLEGAVDELHLKSREWTLSGTSVERSRCPVASISLVMDFSRGIPKSLNLQIV